MFDIANINSVRANPGLAREIVKHLSVYELTTAAKKSANDRYQSLLNQKPIIQGIIESGDEGKMLLLASSSNLHQLMEEKPFQELFEKGGAYRKALYGNYECNWYSILNWKADFIFNQLMEDMLDEDEQYRIAILRNPRMDRNLIASIIGGGKQRLSDKLSFDFTKISYRDRFIAIEHSFQAREIPSEDYPGKDMPDDNEFYFDAPFSAALLFARDLLGNYEDKSAQYFATWIVRHLDIAPTLKLNAEDWVTEDEEQQVKSESSDYKNRFNKLTEIALTHVIELFVKHTSNIESNLENQPKENRPDGLSYFARALIAIVSIPKLLNHYNLQHAAKNVIQVLLNADSWVLRSAAYAYLYRKIDPRTDQGLLGDFLAKYERDGDALLHAIWDTDHSRVLIRHDYNIKYQLQDVFKRAQLDDLTKKHFDENTQYLYGTDVEDLTDEDFEKFLKSWMYKTDNKLVRAFLGSPQSSQSQIKYEDSSLAYSLGKFVSKIIK